jgi:hypothetical protein
MFGLVVIAGLGFLGCVGVDGGGVLEVAWLARGEDNKTTSCGEQY